MTLAKTTTKTDEEKGVTEVMLSIVLVFRETSDLPGGRPLLLQAGACIPLLCCTSLPASKWMQRTRNQRLEIFGDAPSSGREIEGLK